MARTRVVAYPCVAVANNTNAARAAARLTIARIVRSPRRPNGAGHRRTRPAGEERGMDGARNWMRLDMMLRAVLLPPETSGVIGAPQSPRRPSRWRGPRFPLGSSELRDPKVAQEVRARAVRLQRPGSAQRKMRKPAERTVVPKGRPVLSRLRDSPRPAHQRSKRITRRASRQLRASSYMDGAQIARDMTALLTSWMNGGSLYYTTGQYAPPSHVPPGVMATPYRNVRTTHARSEEARHARGDADARPGA